MPTVDEESFSVTGSSGYFGTMIWGQFTWGTDAIGGEIYYFNGYGNNMAISIRTSSKYKETHAFHNFTVDYSMQTIQV